MQQHVTILEKDGTYAILRLYQLVVSNFKPNYFPNIYSREYDSFEESKKNYEIALKESVEHGWAVSWKGVPQYG